MGFSLWRAVQRLWFRKWIYLIVMIQIAIGTNIIIGAMGDFYEQRQGFLNARENMVGEGLIILPTEMGMFNFAEGITYEDFLALREQFKEELGIHYTKVMTLIYPYLSEEEMQLLKINLLFMDDEMRAEWDIPANGDGHYYVGSQLVETADILSQAIEQDKDGDLQPNHYLNDTAFAFSKERDAIVLGDKMLPLKPMPKGLEALIISPLDKADQGVTVGDTLVLPMELLPYFEEHGEESPVFSKWGKLFVKEKHPGTTALWQMIDELTARHEGRFAYQVDNKYLQMKLTLDHHLALFKNKAAMAVTQLLLVSISTAGILYLILLRRKKDIAISMMMGATQRSQVIELLLEVFGMVILGVLMGISLCVYGHRGGVFRQYPQTMLILLGIVIVMGGLASSLALTGLYRLSPIEILQKE